MDVGSDNFRFQIEAAGDDKAKTTRPPKTCELRVDSLDRYNWSMFANATDVINSGSPDQVNAQLAGSTVQPFTLNSVDNCLIQTKRNLLDGYFSRVALTQFQLHYRVPTVVTNYNDRIGFYYIAAPGGTPVLVYATMNQGYYTVETLGTEIRRAMIAVSSGVLTTVNTTITPPTTQQVVLTAGSTITTGYTITITGGPAIYFFAGTTGTNSALQRRVLKAFRLIGVNRAMMGYTPELNTTVQGAVVPATAAWTTATGGVPNMKQTDYIDIVCPQLSNYKENKDANTDIQSPGCVLGRIYLTEYPISSQTAEHAWPQDGMWGMSPMSFTKTWAHPNWSQWSPGQGISSLTFTLLDQWGLPLFWSSTYATEWSATITATE